MYSIQNRIVMDMSSSLYELGRRCFLRPGRVLLAWFLVALIGAGAALALGDGTRDEFDVPGTEANDAFVDLGRTFPELSGLTAYAVVVAPDGTSIESPTSKALVGRTVAALERVDGVTSVTSPYDELARAASISRDDRAAQIQVSLAGDLGGVTERLKSDLQQTGTSLDDAGYTVAFGGDAFSNTGPKLSIIEVIGVVVALVVLYRMFRSWRAAFLPIITALVGVVVTMELLWTATGFLTISSTAPLLALMIGLAVGIDYALFIVSRHRELMADGIPADEAVGRAVATAGSAVVFAGVTVMIALVGLFVAGIPFLTVMGISGAVSVAVAVAVALTLLPALLGRAGDRLQPTAKEKPAGGFSRRWVRLTTRFPAVAMVVVVGVLAVGTLPVKDLQLALPDNGSAPTGSTQREAYDLVDQHLGPGYNGPLLVKLDVITSNDPLGVVDDVERDLRATKGVETIGLATPNRSADTAVIQVIPTTGPASPQTADLVQRIRAEAPRWEQEHGVDVPCSSPSRRRSGSCSPRVLRSVPSSRCSSGAGSPTSCTCRTPDRSSPSCRSCSWPCCSACRWITRCSWSRA